MNSAQNQDFTSTGKYFHTMWIFKYLSLVIYELFSTERFKCVLKSPAWGEAKSHCLHLCDFYPLCVCKCPLRSPAWEDAFPQCVFSNVTVLSNVFLNCLPVDLHFMTFDILWHLAFHNIWHFMIFGISWHLPFHDILHFVTFDISWHLALHDIWHSMTFDNYVLGLTLIGLFIIVWPVKHHYHHPTSYWNYVLG